MEDESFSKKETAVELLASSCLEPVRRGPFGSRCSDALLSVARLMASVKPVTRGPVGSRVWACSFCM